MKGVIILAALCLAVSSECSGLLHTAEPLPVGQLLNSNGIFSGRHLLESMKELAGEKFLLAILC